MTRIPLPILNAPYVPTSGYVCSPQKVFFGPIPTIQQTINALLALSPSSLAKHDPEAYIPSHTPSHRAPLLHQPPQNILTRGETLFNKTYTKVGERVMGQMDNSGAPDLGLLARLMYGYVLAGPGAGEGEESQEEGRVLSKVEGSWVLIAGLVPQDVSADVLFHRGEVERKPPPNSPRPVFGALNPHRCNYYNSSIDDLMRGRGPNREPTARNARANKSVNHSSHQADESATQVNPQLKGHLKGALNHGATVEEVRGVRDAVLGICEAAGMRRLDLASHDADVSSTRGEDGSAPGGRSVGGWREAVAKL